MTSTAPQEATQRKPAPATEPVPAEEDLIDLLVAYVIRIAPSLKSHRASIERDLRAEFGGDRWYIQARTETQRQARVREVLQRFNGRNATEVARELHISRATVYRMLKQPGQPAQAMVHKRLSHALPTAETA